MALMKLNSTVPSSKPRLWLDFPTSTYGRPLFSISLSRSLTSAAMSFLYSLSFPANLSYVPRSFFQLLHHPRFFPAHQYATSTTTTIGRRWVYLSNALIAVLTRSLILTGSPSTEYSLLMAFMFCS